MLAIFAQFMLSDFFRSQHQHTARIITDSNTLSNNHTLPYGRRSFLTMLLSKLIKKYTGNGFSTYLSLERMIRAEYLLAKTDDGWVLKSKSE